MMESPQRPAGLISQDNLEKMAQELIQLCDGIERHGLVDYQYGVWEEKILQSKLPSFPVLLLPELALTQLY